MSHPVFLSSSALPRMPEGSRNEWRGFFGHGGDDVAGAHARAIAAGASELSAPVSKPWGQVVSYVRCPDGTLVELCSPIGG